jgi:hypothetical protein
MITSEVKSPQTFILEIAQGEGNDIRATIRKQNGESYYFLVPRTKLYAFTAIHATVRHVVDFLLGDYRA